MGERSYCFNNLTWMLLTYNSVMNVNAFIKHFYVDNSSLVLEMNLPISCIFSGKKMF